MILPFRAVLFFSMALFSMMVGTMIDSAMADTNTDDVHCLMVYMEMSSADNSTIRTAGVIGSWYFMGKLDGRAPDFDLESRIVEEAPKLTSDMFRAEANRCSKELEDRGIKESAMGKDMVERGEKTHPDAKVAPKPDVKPD